jgi:hypothetical protein
MTDTLAALEEAARAARAASHSKRLDTATQAALQALVAFAMASVAHARAHAQRSAAIADDHPDFRHVNQLFDP